MLTNALRRPRRGDRLWKIADYALFCGESLSVQLEQTAPCLLGLPLIIHARIRRAPAMRGASLVIGRTLIVVIRNRNDELRLRLHSLEMRSVLAIGHQSSAM